jgi:methylase of polypeptide subunit release factors
MIKGTEGGLQLSVNSLPLSRPLINVKGRTAAVDIAVKHCRFAKLSHAHFNMVSVNIIAHHFTSLLFYDIIIANPPPIVNRGWRY